LTFATLTTPEGMKVERRWELQGAQGDHFVGRLSFSNPTSAPLRTSHTEVIPKSLASSVTKITFDLQPTVIQADPVVQYSLTVPTGGEVTARYEIEVAPTGASRARLKAWAADLAAQDAKTPTTTGPTTTGPTTTGPTTTTTGPTTSTSTTTSTLPAGPGTIIVRIVSRGGTGTFNFSGPGSGLSGTTAGSPDGTAQSPAVTVAAGTYAWTQTSSPGWAVASIDCSDRDGPIELRSTASGTTARFNVQAGETVVCTWTNDRA
jgi:hypothetical protein